MIQNNFLKFKGSNLKSINLIFVLIIFLVPSPYRIFTFPVESNWTFLTLMLLIFHGGKSKKSMYFFLSVILVLKVYSIIFSNNFYAVCYLSIDAQNQHNECVETFDQYSVFSENEIQYKITFDEGIEADKKTYFGHSESSWDTDYLTGLNYKGSSFAPSSSEGKWNYNWLPFKVNIEKSFNNPTSLNIIFFGDIKIYSDKKLIYEGSNYENTEIINLNLLPSEVLFEFQYFPSNSREYLLKRNSDFEIEKPMHFATLRIKEVDTNNYLEWAFLLLLVMVFVLNEYRNTQINKSTFIKIFLLVLFNYLVFIFINNQIIISFLLSLAIIYFKFSDKKNFLFVSLILFPFQILKVFDNMAFKLPRMPGTVAQHHQVKALAMNLDLNFRNYLRGGDDLFYEPPLFRYILNFLNLLFGDNWKLVCVIFLFLLLFTLNNLFTNEIKQLFYFLGLLLFFSSSGFLSLLITGWSEPFNFLILIFAVSKLLTNNEVDKTFVFLIALSILLRPEGIVYLLPLLFFLLYKTKSSDLKLFIPLFVLFLPMLHNLYFSGEFYLFSSTGNELGFSESLSKDGYVPFLETLNKFSLSKFKGMFFIPFNSQSLMYVGNGFLILNFFLFIYVLFFLLFNKKDTLFYYILFLLSISPFFIYNIFDGYPRRALTLTLVGIVTFLIANHKTFGKTS